MKRKIILFYLKSRILLNILFLLFIKEYIIYYLILKIQEYGIIYNYNNNSITHLNTFINNCKDELINILSIYNYTKKSKEVEIVPFEIIFRWNGIIFPGLNKINFYLTIKLIKKLLSNKYVCYLNKLKLISILDNITESKKSNAFNLL